MSPLHDEYRLILSYLYRTQVHMLFQMVHTYRVTRNICPGISLLSNITLNTTKYIYLYAGAASRVGRTKKCESEWDLFVRACTLPSDFRDAARIDPKREHESRRGISSSSPHFPKQPLFCFRSGHRNTNKRRPPFPLVSLLENRKQLQLVRLQRRVLLWQRHREGLQAVQTEQVEHLSSSFPHINAVDSRWHKTSPQGDMTARHLDV